MCPFLCAHHQALPHTSTFLGSTAHPALNFPHHMLGIQLQLLLCDNNLLPENPDCIFNNGKAFLGSPSGTASSLLAESVILQFEVAIHGQTYNPLTFNRPSAKDKRKISLWPTDPSERCTSQLPCMNTHHPITTEQFSMTDRIFSTETRVDALRVLWHPRLLLGVPPARGSAWGCQSCRTSRHSSREQLEHRERF